MTINGNGLVRRYDRLTPDERFRAALEASARGDMEERDRLIDSCPQRTYRMSDHMFMDRLDLSRDLAMAVALELGALPGLLLATGRVDADDEIRNAVVEQLVMGAAAAYEAFAEVCRERLGVEPETVLLAHLGPLYVERLGLEILQEAEPGEDATRQWRVLFERRIVGA